MDNLCNSCANYNKDYDLFRQQYYDFIMQEDTKEKHGCIMYDDHIPEKIWYHKGNCPYYIKKG